MSSRGILRGGGPLGLSLIIAVQVICTAFFVLDVIADFRAYGPANGIPYHLAIETAATACLIIAIVIESRMLAQLLRRKAHLERSLAIAGAAMQDVIDAHFRAWGLSPSETDVATFLVKGMTIAEIAALRGSAEGTIKAHLNAIYRKSGTQNRGDLLSVLLDSVMAGTPPASPVAARDRSR